MLYVSKFVSLIESTLNIFLNMFVHVILYVDLILEVGTTKSKKEFLGTCKIILRGFYQFTFHSTDCTSFIYK